MYKMRTRVINIGACSVHLFWGSAFESTRMQTFPGEWFCAKELIQYNGNGTRIPSWDWLSHWDKKYWHSWRKKELCLSNGQEDRKSWNSDTDRLFHLTCLLSDMEEKFQNEKSRMKWEDQLRSPIEKWENHLWRKGKGIEKVIIWNSSQYSI